MNHSSRWPWVILISSVQLALLLSAVVVLFAWLGDTANSTLSQQTCLENHAICGRISGLIKSKRVRDVRLETSKDRQQLETFISAVEIPNNGFAMVFDYGTGMLISHRPPKKRALGTRLDDILLVSLTSEDVLGTLRNVISNKPEKRIVNGRVGWEGKEHFVTAQYLPELNGVLLVGQERSLASLRLAAALHLTKYYAFAGTLLIGLVGICLTVTFVSRVNHTVDCMSDGMEKIVSHNARELVRTKNAVIFGLAKLAESRDNDTGEHLDRIRSYVMILAEDMALSYDELDEEFIHNLELASSLHDIGKVGIPDSILLKPGRLSAEERGIMELHTLIGGECLDAIHARLGENEFMHIARQVAYYHHERWDGTGYPHSLRGAEIPLVARIVAVADVYDALTSKRPYKKAMKHIEGKEIIVSGSGKHFDPQVVEAFLRNEDKFEEISRRQQYITDEEATSNFQRLCEALKN